jgi:hypothetical protein
VLEIALDILENPGDYSREEILDIKNILDEFANQPAGS